jgi:hypothetical protein
MRLYILEGREYLYWFGPPKNSTIIYPVGMYLYGGERIASVISASDVSPGWGGYIFIGGTVS